MNKDNLELEFFMVKPDGVSRGLVGECFKRLENAGLKIVAMKMKRVSKEEAESLYSIHKGKEFYDSLIDYIRSGPVVVSVIAGKEAVKLTRKLIGATDPVKANTGTIRGDYAQNISHNVVHAADSPKNAKKELSIFFEKSSLIKSYKRTVDPWL